MECAQISPTKYKKQILQMIEQQVQSDVYESGWFAFNAFTFLHNKNKVQNTNSSISIEGMYILGEKQV